MATVLAVSVLGSGCLQVLRVFVVLLLLLLLLLGGLPARVSTCGRPLSDRH